MSLKINLSEQKNVILQPVQTVALNGEIEIERIVDLPKAKKVFVFAEGIGRIQLDSLSDDNYDNPADWTNADIVAGVEAWINANS